LIISINLILSEKIAIQILKSGFHKDKYSKRPGSEYWIKNGKQLVLVNFIMVNVTPRQK